MIFFKLALRNVFRHKRRTILSGIAIGIGLAILIFRDAFMLGMNYGLIKSATNTFLGQGQIHAKGFRETFDVENTIHNLDAIENGLKGEPRLLQYTKRTQAFGMVTSPSDVASLMVFGIDPKTERDISQIDEAIIKGEYLTDDDPQKILLGSKTAEFLDVSVGDKIVVTVAMANTGELSQEMFRVGGIFQLNSKAIDNGFAYIHIDKARTLLGIGQDIHEIAIKFKDINDSGDKKNAFWDKYSKDDNEAIGWRQMIPQINAMFEMLKYQKIIMCSIIFSIVGLIIMNTLFMSLYERLYEFGVLRAIGTKPINLASMIILESCVLSVISIIIGIIIGFSFCYYYSINGITTTSTEFGGTSLTEPLYTIMKFSQYIFNPLYVFIFSIVAAIYPAIYAARLTPAKAMKRSM